MEDDNEILDWDNEDDEHHESLRKPLHDSYQRDIGDLDAEDSISLGDEDEGYRNENNTNGSSNVRDIMGSQRRASTPQLTSLTIGAKQDSHGEATHGKLSTPRKSSFSEDSPRRKQHSRDQASPQRSQPNPGRLTHALPPKPNTVPPFLSLSHPSIVEATSMVISTRTGGRETKKNNGVSSATAIPSIADELPQNWEYREARTGGGRYYYNTETHVSTWEKPVSSVPSASDHAESRRRRSSSTGRRHRTPPDSNPHQSQTTRASLNSTHMPPDREMDDNTKTALVLPALSYEDRHYRPAAEPSSAVVEIRATDRHSDAMNGRVSSRSRYDRMPPASPPPSRKRARSLSPRESQASSWRPGRRHNDESMLDEHPDSRNRSSLRRRESSLEPNRYQDLPPRPSELHEDANQNPVYLSAPRRGSTPPPYARDRDRHYEPIIRDYRAPPEEDPRSIASRRDRSFRHDDRPAPINIHAGPAEVSSNRQRDRDIVPSSNFTHPSRRVSEREYDRNRHEQQIPERDGLPRRPAEYPPPANQIPEQTKGHYDREPSRPHPSDFDRSAQDHLGQSSHRKRAPLPPQATTFLTSSIAPEHARATPPQSSAAPVAPRSLRDFSGHDSNVPLGPRSMTHANEELPPRNGPTGGAEYDRDRGRNTSRQPNHYPAPAAPPSINTSMNVDDQEGRMDKYSRSKDRNDEYRKAPSQPSSGTNNIPIGNKRSPYNPDARPPPSTLIDPVKARELLPPGKECYERPADLEITDTPQVKTTNDALIQNTSRPSESAERQPTLPPTAAASGKPRQRKSRFDKSVPQPEPRREPSPVLDKSEASNMRAVTLPPLTPEPSVESLQDEAPPPPLPAHPGNALASSRSGQRPGNRWSGDTRRNSLDQPPEYVGLPPTPGPTSLSYRLSNDKSRVRQGRDEGDEGEVELSFQNAHAELEREPVFQQERLERPQVQRRGASLLDRLSTGTNPARSQDSAAQQSLRDRLIPSKRDFEDMTDEGMQQHDVSFDGEDGTESKRARRKSGRARTRGGRRGGPA